MKKITLSPTLFLILEIIFLTPSVLIILSLIIFFFTKNPSLYFLVISKNNLQNILSLIVCPIAGGFLAYQYLERFKAKGAIAKISKILLGYSIIGVGIVIVFFLFRLIKIG